MKYDILTLFPEMVLQGLHTSIVGRAMDKGILSVEAINIRDLRRKSTEKWTIIRTEVAPVW